MLDSKQTSQTENNAEHYRKLVFRGWFIVCGIAVAFVLYGLFAFFVIGDRQPDWDFGAIEDTPAESVYSTYPYRGQTEEPEVQHVDRKSPNASTTISDNPPPPGSEEKAFDEPVRKGRTGQPEGPGKKGPSDSK